ncbi:MAG: lipopolysaccharide biosynthesis protein [Ardenticatenaceae bacterium]|nr:MAG: lipopolysaccharide biosynthesis protein [Ardenticatenaceae bacterium]
MVNDLPPSPSSDEFSVARQTAVGSTYTIAASLITLVVGFSRSIILARLLFPADYGLFALAFFFVRLLERVQMFGFTAAFVHKHQHTNEEAAAHFVLRFGASLLVLALAALMTPLLTRFYPDLPRLGQVVIVITAVRLINAFNITPKTILSKQLQFKRLAILRVLGSTFTLVVTSWLALRGAGIWALVAQDTCFFLIEFVGLWLYRRPWRLAVRTNLKTIKWYFQFGKFHLVAKNISVLLDSFDDFWVGTFLGSSSLGFYTKAYEFAQYPRSVIGDPINNVLYPVFAKLQDDRDSLSRAFYRSASLLVRLGFLLAGAFVFVTPEFVQLFLGSKWLPMQQTFQLMLVYTLLDPILAMFTQLILANGQPKILARAQLWQMLFFVPAVMIASNHFGIEGVAVAADLMLIVGFVVILPKLRQFVDFSLRQLVGVPILAIATALLGSVFVMSLLPELHTAVILIQKGLVVAVIYTSVLLLLEREQLQKSGQIVMQMIRRG